VRVTQRATERGGKKTKCESIHKETTFTTALTVSRATFTWLLYMAVLVEKIDLIYE